MFRSTLTLLLGGLLALHSQAAASASLLAPTDTVRRLPPCDYLVVGAGAASLSFVDTLLKEKPTLNIVLVDHHHAPGGHWNDAYDHVLLHQPSFLYGVESRALERVDPKAPPGSEFVHRANKYELLKYFADVVKGWERDYNVRYFNNSWFGKRGFGLAKGGVRKQCGSEEAGAEDCGMVYEFEQPQGSGKMFSIAVREKVVDGTKGEPSVPATSAPKFAVEISEEAARAGVTREQVLVYSASRSVRTRTAVSMINPRTSV